MSNLSTILELVQVILNLEARIEEYLKEVSDEKRRAAIRAAIMARDVPLLNALICD